MKLFYFLAFLSIFVVSANSFITLTLSKNITTGNPPETTSSNGLQGILQTLKNTLSQVVGGLFSTTAAPSTTTTTTTTTTEASSATRAAPASGNRNTRSTTRSPPAFVYRRSNARKTLKRQNVGRILAAVPAANIRRALPKARAPASYVYRRNNYVQRRRQ